MKNLFALFLMSFVVLSLKAQSTQGINYQAVARNAAGALLVNQSIGVRMSIIDGSAIGTIQYSETHAVSTNQFGLFTLVVGNGNAITGWFDSITWNTGNKFIKVEIDPNGGSEFVEMGTSKLQSVPYALYAPGVVGPMGPKGPVGPQGPSSDTISLSNRINLKLDLTDTASMLAPYLRNTTGLEKDTISTGTKGYSITRKESTPSAPVATIITDNTGNCTPGTHVFAIVFNTTSGHTDVSPISNSITCDATHTKVRLSIPEGIMYVMNRDIYASKANTIAPLYLVSSAPVIPYAIENTDQAELNTYIFNISDTSFTSIIAPTSNTATDNVYSFGPNGQMRFGNGPNSISGSINYLFNGVGSANVGMFQRFDPGEARLTILNGGVTASNKFNYPTLAMINPGITVGINGAFTYTPLAANSVISTIAIRGTYKTDGSFSHSEGPGFSWVTTEAWNENGQGTKLKVHLLRTGYAFNVYFPLVIDDINGSVFTGTTNDSTTYALQIKKSDNTSMLSVRDDGRIGIGTVTPTAVLHLKPGSTTASTAPLKFTSGALLTNTEPGAIEFLTDAYYGTITTGATRKQFAFTSDLTSYLPLAGGTISGNLIATQYRICSLNTAPANASAPGTTGEIRITSGFIYVCIATNTWVRAPLTSW